MALTRERADGTYYAYFPFALTTEASQQRRYHDKLLDIGKLKTITLLLVLALEPQTKDKGKHAE